jgi:hypothetical protein
MEMPKCITTEYGRYLVALIAIEASRFGGVLYNEVRAHLSTQKLKRKLTNANIYNKGIPPP